MNSNRAEILDRCKKYDLKVISLRYDRKSQPTPGGYVTRGWELICRYQYEEILYVGDATDILDELDEDYSV